MKLTVKGMENFSNKIEALKNLNVSEITNTIAEKGKTIAEENVYSEAVVSTEITSDNSARVIASDEHISFVEFGVGTLGDGQYMGNLPTQKLRFIGRDGQEHTTSGWVYNYWIKEKEHKDDEPYLGFAPKAPMWKTTEELTTGGKGAEAINELFEKKGIT